jgi:hypothetical protein
MKSARRLIVEVRRREGGPKTLNLASFAHCSLHRPGPSRRHLTPDSCTNAPDRRPGIISAALVLELVEGTLADRMKQGFGARLRGAGDPAWLGADSAPDGETFLAWPS